MIKAETITHEGNIGPNWLDKCRSAITPVSTSIGLVIVAVVIISVVAGLHHRTTPYSTQASSVPSQSTGATLQVSPLSGSGQAAASASTAATPAVTNPLQSTTTTSSSSPATQATTSSLQSSAANQASTANQVAPQQNSQAATPTLSGLTSGLNSTVTSGASSLQGSASNIVNATTNL